MSTAEVGETSRRYGRSGKSTYRSNSFMRDFNSKNLNFRMQVNEENEAGKDTAHIKFLLSAAKCWNNISSDALRIHLNIHCGDIIRQDCIQLVGRKNALCNFCRMPWSNGLFSVKVLPSVKKGKKMKKILRRAKASKKLSRIEERLVNSHHSRNTLVVKCLVCKKNSIFNTDKPVNFVNATSPPTSSIGEDNIKIKKKRKKKKDKYCGLSPIVVSEARLLSNNEFHKKKSNFNGNNVKSPPGSALLSQGTVVNLSNSKDISEDIEEKTGEMKMKKIKANSLSVTPLGLIGSSSPASKSYSGFIPLEDKKLLRSEEISKASKIKVQETEKRGLQGSPCNQYINPFSDRVRKENKKRNNKKLSSLKRLIAAEERKPTDSPSLRDFLTTV